MELLEKDQEFLNGYEKVYLQAKVNLIMFFCCWFLYASLALIGPVSEISKHSNNAFNVYAFVAFSPVVIMIIIHLKRKKKFLKSYGINKTEAGNYYQFLTNDIVYAPLLHWVCQLNPDANSSQIELIKKWYNIADNTISAYFFNKEYSEEDWDEAVNQLKKQEPSSKKEIINRLFQLVILEDGIHNDEWKLMMQLIAQLEFNKNYVNYFKERYESLRTEFDEYEKRSDSSEYKYVYSLKEYYATLGLEENATDEEVRRAYHELALQHHPDLPKNAGRVEECEKMMMKINEAYEKLRSKS